MLKAADVEQKTFSTALRGYDLDEVDDFLDEVVATIRDLNEKLEEAKIGQTAEPAAPEVTPEPVRETPAAAEKATGPSIDESAVGRALIAAQTAADKLLEEAESQASKVLEDAKEQADSWETEREVKKAEAQAEMAALAERVRSVRSELAVLAEQVSGKLDDMDTVIASGETGDVDDDAGSTDDANQVTVLDTSSDESGAHEVETGAEDTDTSDSADHLDQILTGVAADLQLSDAGDDDVSHEDSYQEDPDGDDSGDPEDSYDSEDEDSYGEDK